MKKLEIIIKAERLEIVKAILDRHGVNGMNIVSVMGYGRQNGVIRSYNGKEYSIGFLPKLKCEAIISDAVLEDTIQEIVDEVNTGNFGDGKIAVYDVVDYIRIRTGERGEAAL